MKTNTGEKIDPWLVWSIFLWLQEKISGWREAAYFKNMLMQEHVQKQTLPTQT